jgi:fructokinase
VAPLGGARRRRYGAVEAGGTKWVCAVGSGPDDLGPTTTIATTSPAETIAATVAFLAAAGPLDAVGIGSFGPVDLRMGSPTWGCITATPKPGWSGTDVAGPIGTALGVPIAFDTDVGAAAAGEHRWGATRDVGTSCYVTIGTGIGGAFLVGGVVQHGLTHAEMGHQRIPHDRAADPFPGSCPFHGDCWEGLASGPAIAARWGRPADELPDDHEAWRLEARYVAAALANLALVLSPERIVVGGGVGQRPSLLAAVRAELAAQLAGYLTLPPLDAFVVPPGLGARAGVLGAVALAAALAPDGGAEPR